MEIKEVKKGSVCDRAGIKKGQNLAKINGNHIRDNIDLLYYSAEDELDILIDDDGVKKEYHLSGNGDIGIKLCDPEYKRCNNRCIFCFVDQLPRGLRESLYFKDDDYRLSFLYGNYITLTNITDDEIGRIIEQKLSPLYISVHSTDREVRSFMFGNRKASQILPLLTSLTEGNIELRTQIVVCPDINDGESLIRTILALSRYYPKLSSVAVVPVGLTKYRESLYPLKEVKREYVKNIIDSIHLLQRDFRKKFGRNFVYLSDEFYIKANRPIPQLSYYDGFPQIEDGVGMTRLLTDDIEKAKKTLPEKLQKKRHVTFCTGELAYRFLKDLVAALNRVGNLNVKLLLIKNKFFGESVSTSGLLLSSDIIESFKNIELGDRLFLPPNCINEEKLFIDGMSIGEMKEELKIEIRTSNIEKTVEIATS